jgi:hypothetical protein
MAGDWIKVEKVTPDKPEVRALHKLLDCTREHAFGLCFRFWCWCDDHLTDGFISHSDKEEIDHHVRQDGFADAMIKVGWIREGSDGQLSVAHFERHLSMNAKRRLADNERQRKHRSQRNGVTRGHK